MSANSSPNVILSEGGVEGPHNASCHYAVLRHSHHNSIPRSCLSRGQPALYGLFDNLVAFSPAFRLVAGLPITRDHGVRPRAGFTLARVVGAPMPDDRGPRQAPVLRLLGWWCTDNPILKKTRHSHRSSMNCALGARQAKY